jgi:hypothetical protein
MVLASTLLFTSILLVPPHNPAQTPRQGSGQARDTDCSSWQECKRLALAAADRQEYELFHDLAWHAVQKGPKSDPDLLTMLARAQSLSGRPHDALVMLQRLAAMGIVTDAATNDDFRRVRELPGWGDLGRATADAAATTKAGGKAETSAEPETKTPRPDVEKLSKEGTVAGDAAEAIRFVTPAFTPAGLAYDDVSDRFIVGDRTAHKLTVVDEASQRVANLAGAQSAGFGEIAALEIDSHEGDLWVVSSRNDEPGGATLHKLQLISARVLYTLSLPESFGAARFGDVAVAPRSTVIVLDSLGNRLFSVAPKSHDLKLAAGLETKRATSAAPESESIVYVAHEKGIVQVDLTSRRSRTVKAGTKIDLSGLERIRWHHGSLVGTQKAADGSYRIVRIRLAADGRTATSLEVLDSGVPMPGPTAAALCGDVFYYVAKTTASETTVRRVTVK